MSFSRVSFGATVSHNFEAQEIGHSNEDCQVENLEWASSIPSAILKGRFEVAKKMIRLADDAEINYALYGCTALNACLSSSEFPRNLELASMLLEKGADPNFLPELNIENWTSNNPFESLVVFYIAAVEAFSCHGDPGSFEGKPVWCKTCKNLLQTIGVDGKPVKTAFELLFQTRLLIEEFLDRGADPNLQINEKKWTPFFLFCMSYNAGKDLRLIDSFLRSNAHLSGQDSSGQPILAQVVAWDISYGASRLRSIEKLSQRLTPSKNVISDVDWEGSHRPSESPAFRCMAFANPKCAKVFMDNSSFCFTTLVFRVPFKKPLIQDRHFILEVPICAELTPILAPFLYNSSIMNRTFTALRKFPEIIKHYISPIVDENVFCDKISDLLIRNLFVCLTKFPHLKYLAIKGCDIVQLMFGNASAGLTQLCIRTWLYRFLFNDRGVELISLLGDFMERPVISSSSEASNFKKIDNTFIKLDTSEIQTKLQTSKLCCIRRWAGLDDCFPKEEENFPIVRTDDFTSRKRNFSEEKRSKGNDISDASSSLSSTSSRIDASWGGGAFSLRLTTAASTKPRMKPDSPDFHSLESVILNVTPRVARRISDHLRIPFGLYSRVEIEIAKLQLIICANAFQFNFSDTCYCSAPKPHTTNFVDDSTDDETADLPMDSQF